MNPRDESKGWIGVDFDGTLAVDDGEEHDEDHVGEPIEPMVRQVRKWLQEGKDVRIFTARKPHPAIRKFSKEQFGRILPITDKKDHEMQAMYDDRAVGIKRNTGEPFSDDNVKQIFEEEYPDSEE